MDFGLTPICQDVRSKGLRGSSFTTGISSGVRPGLSALRPWKEVLSLEDRLWWPAGTYGLRLRAGFTPRANLNNHLLFSCGITANPWRTNNGNRSVA